MRRHASIDSAVDMYLTSKGRQCWGEKTNINEHWAPLPSNNGTLVM
jgi:hypothetical protein